MQINLQPIFVDVGSAAGTAANAAAALPELAEGESLQARVIFSGGDAVNLKTADSTVIRARLEGGVQLAEGSVVNLTLVEKSDGLLKLRIVGMLPPGVDASGSVAERLPTLPQSLATLVEQLQNSALNPAQRLEAFMRAVEDFPGLSNRDAVVRQATTLLLGSTSPTAALPGSNATTQPAIGQLLQQLAALLNLPEQGAQPPAQLAQAPSSLGQVVPEQPFPATLPPTAAAALFALFMPELAAPPDGAGQPQIAALPQEPTQQLATSFAAVLPQLAEALASASPPGAQTASLTPPGAANAAAPVTMATSLPEQTTAPPLTVLTALPPATRQEVLEFTQRLVAELYPAGTDEPALKEINAFVERLFTKISPDKNNGQELHQAARELETRLSLLQEALERSSLPHKQELLQQANRLQQQTESLRDERPLCLQFPIQFAEQRQTAELYIYRRNKGSRQLDPRHATILLALNTEHLGRLEALMQVRQKDITLKMEIGRADAVPFMKEQAGSLASLLLAAGFRLASATVQPLTQETSPQTAQQTLEKFQSGFGHQVDLTI